jgi:hypothetical protein
MPIWVPRAGRLMSASMRGRAELVAPSFSSVCAREARSCVTMRSMELTEKGRAMTDDKTEHHAMSVSTFLLMFFASCAPGVASIAAVEAAADGADASGTFHTKCEMCHGPDGAGSELGKSLHVPDPHSPAVQKLLKCATGANHFRRKSDNTIVQKFAERGSDPFSCRAHSYAARKEIVRT